MNMGTTGILLDVSAAGSRVALGSPRAEAHRFEFSGLDHISRSEVELARRLAWILPDGLLAGESSEALQGALHRIFDTKVQIWLDYAHIAPPTTLHTLIAKPTFLAAIAASAHAARGLIEVDLVLAHGMIDLLLGAPVESAVARPLTEIEQGVLSYVMIETLRALSQARATERGATHLRLDRVLASVDEGVALLADEPNVAVVELNVVVGTATTGYVRLLLPASVVQASAPPEATPLRRARRLERLQHKRNLWGDLRIPLRAEIGTAELTGSDFAALRPGNVMLVDMMATRSDKGEEGRAILRVGLGRAGHFEAKTEVVNGSYRATVEQIVLTAGIGDEDAEAGSEEHEEPAESQNEPAEAAAPSEGEPAEGEDESAEALGADEEKEWTDTTAIMEMDEIMGDDPASPEESSQEGKASNVKPKKDESIRADAAELLNDVPLQVVVELGRVSVTAEELVSFHVGKIIELRRGPGDPVELSVNGKLVAHGEVVEVEGQLGVRVLALAE